MNNLPRTNNNVEAWHKQFEMCCGKNPGLFKLISNFIEEQKRTELKLEQAKGKKGEHLFNDSDKELRIYLLCNDFEVEKFEEFIQGMILNLEE
jgi:hypothetical protein